MDSKTLYNKYAEIRAHPNFYYQVVEFNKYDEALSKLLITDNLEPSMFRNIFTMRLIIRMVIKDLVIQSKQN